MPSLEDYLTTKEVAEELGYHVNHVRRMIRNGYLVGMKVGHTMLITKVSLDEFKKNSSKYQKHDRRKIEMLNK